MTDATGQHPQPNLEELIDPTVPPSGTGCVECLASDGWWYHLRRCARCGHIGCCDTSPSQHASRHVAETGHYLVRTFEPDEDWFFHFGTNEYWEGLELAPPQHRPLEQPVPGPEGRVPADWQEHLN